MGHSKYLIKAAPLSGPTIQCFDGTKISSDFKTCKNTLALEDCTEKASAIKNVLTMAKIFNLSPHIVSKYEDVPEKCMQEFHVCISIQTSIQIRGFCLCPFAYTTVKELFQLKRDECKYISRRDDDRIIKSYNGFLRDMQTLGIEYEKYIWGTKKLLGIGTHIIAENLALTNLTKFINRKEDFDQIMICTCTTDGCNGDFIDNEKRPTMKGTSTVSSTSNKDSIAEETTNINQHTGNGKSKRCPNDAALIIAVLGAVKEFAFL